MQFSIPTLLCTILLGGASATPSPSTKRDTAQPDQIICNIPNFHRETQDELLKGDISDLRSGGSITVGHQEGGGFCSRIKCANGFDGDVAIYVCNDAAEDVTVDPTDLADYAQAIINTNSCLSEERIGRQYYKYVQGQAFNHTGGWNVILGVADGDSC